MKLLYSIVEGNPLKKEDYTGEHLHLAVFTIFIYHLPCLYHFRVIHVDIIDIHMDSLLHCNILNSEKIFCNDLFWWSLHFMHAEQVLINFFTLVAAYYESWWACHFICFPFIQMIMQQSVSHSSPPPPHTQTY